MVPAAAGPGAALDVPIRVGTSINWSQQVVFAPRPGILAAGGAGGPVRTFRHQDWTSGGTAVAADRDLFTAFTGPAIIGVASQEYAIGAVDGMVFGVWQDSKQFRGHDDIWYSTGALPPGITGVAGDADWLYGVDPAGQVVLLAQDPTLPACPPFPGRRWGRGWWLNAPLAYTHRSWCPRPARRSARRSGPS